MPTVHTQLETDVFLGYKFETLSTLPAPWAEMSRDSIENRDQEAVSNKAQYCSVVRTGIGKTILCLGGEVDAGTSSHRHITFFFLPHLCIAACSHAGQG